MLALDKEADDYSPVDDHGISQTACKTVVSYERNGARLRAVSARGPDAQRTENLRLRSPGGESGGSRLGNVLRRANSPIQDGPRVSSLTKLVRTTDTMLTISPPRNAAQNPST